VAIAVAITARKNKKISTSPRINPVKLASTFLKNAFMNLRQQI
jgi:hypothetical protein